jgi:flagellar FliL protein
MSAKPAKPAAPAAPAEAAPAPAKSKKMLIIIGLVVLAVAGGAGLVLLKNSAPAEEHAAEAHKPEPVIEPKFIPLGEKFTVNLQREEGDQYLQVGITLKILEADLEMKLKAAMPEVRSKLLILLSSKKPSELITTEGKKLLVEQVIAEVDGILGIAVPAAEPAAPAAHGDGHGEGHGDAHAASAPAPAAPKPPKTTGVVDVLFSDFIIQ